MDKRMYLNAKGTACALVGLVAVLLAAHLTRPASVSAKEKEIRVGDYRIIYQVKDAALIVLVLSIGHRRDIYRR